MPAFRVVFHVTLSVSKFTQAEKKKKKNSESKVTNFQEKNRTHLLPHQIWQMCTEIPSFSFMLKWKNGFIKSFATDMSCKANSQLSPAKRRHVTAKKKKE